MIEELIIKNFKLFKEEAHVPLSRINLLTGINGRGKSTVLQTLLLMKQSPDHDRTTNKIIFNGSCIRLGGYKDVKNIESNENIELSFKYNDFFIKYSLKPNESDPMVADIEYIESGGCDNKFRLHLQRNGDFFLGELYENDQKSEFNAYLHDLFISNTILVQKKLEVCEALKETLNFSKIHYVSADRIGPKLYYQEKSIKDFPSVGSLGEDTINALFHYENKTVGSGFIDNINRFFHVVTEDIGKTVGLQTEFWLNKLFDGAKYEIKRVEEANLLTFGISPDGTFNYYKPTNVGFGYTYILPIIVAGLIAKPGEIFIVENPEAHLHPYAQSIVSKFLTLVSLNGVQVIIESHSEHILNGLRIPVYDKIIPSEYLNILYFDRNLGEKPFIKIPIENDGGIQNWPSNFFDQSTKDLNYLFGL
jgi:predicted ATPase